MNSFEGEIVSTKELRQKPSPTESTLHVEIKLPEGVTYKTAGNLKIYPKTSQALINRLLSHQGWSADTVLTFESKSKLPFPSPIKLTQLLREYVDLQGMLKKSNLKALYEIAKAKSTRDEYDIRLTLDCLTSWIIEKDWRVYMPSFGISLT